MVNRYRSRQERLDHSLLAERLRGARRYHRIAGFFSSALLQVAGVAARPTKGLCLARKDWATGSEDLRVHVGGSLSRLLGMVRK